MAVYDTNERAHLRAELVGILARYERGVPWLADQIIAAQPSAIVSTETERQTFITYIKRFLKEENKPQPGARRPVRVADRIVEKIRIYLESSGQEGTMDIAPQTDSPPIERIELQHFCLSMDRLELAYYPGFKSRPVSVSFICGERNGIVVVLKKPPHKFLPLLYLPEGGADVGFWYLVETTRDNQIAKRYKVPVKFLAYNDRLPEVMPHLFLLD